MRITADTNILVRAITADEPAQAESARRVLTEAEAVALPLPVLCELVWVLRRGYAATTDEIASVLRHLVDGAECLVDRPGVEAGLALLDAGGDFADGVIAHEGRKLGGEIFVSFDRRAVELIRASGEPARLLD